MSNTLESRDELFGKLLKGNLSPQEKEELLKWLGKEHLDGHAAELIMAQLSKAVPVEQITPEILSALEERLPLVLESGRPSLIRRITSSRWLRYAASIVVLLGVGYFFLSPRFKNNTDKGENVNLVQTVVDPQPGKDGAILILNDGTQLVLDDLKDGLITTQNGIKVLLKGGQVTYVSESSVAENKLAYHTMATPRGRQFQLMLPDGSKVWLNAASSIRYPIRFPGKERKVEITGEAYFEIAKDLTKPFKVMIDSGTEIEVLGTYFNINSYRDEGGINTTLLEGSLKVTNAASKSVVLTPGQQAQIKRVGENEEENSTVKVISNVDVERVMAWKNGVFNFQDATLEEVMRQLERWYDIDVVYEKGIPPLEFYGKMGRDLTLSTVLRGLNLSNVNFRIEDGRKLVVTP